jgi:hypothetical protein
MATLEDAADELAATLKELDHELEEGQQSLVSFAGKLDTDTQRVEDGWKTLAERVDAFLQHLPDHARSMDEGVQEAGQALADLHAGVAADDGAAQSAVAASRDGVASLEEHLKALPPPLESVVAEEVEAPLQELARRAEDVRASLDEALAESRAFLEGDLVLALGAVGAQIRARVEEACQGPLAHCAGEIQQAYEGWEQSLDTAEDLILEKSYAAAPGHAERAVEHASQACRGAYEEALAGLEQAAEVVEGALRELQEESTLRAAALRAEGQEELSSGHHELLEAMAGASRALDAVKQLLASFTFVQL